MPVFVPWTNNSPVPDVGTSETMVLDFKGIPSKRRDAGDERDPRNWDHAKNAKDVAAFANAIGGVLVVGGDDNGGTGKLARFVDIDAALADRIETHYTEVTKDHVRPSPVVSFARIARGESFLVAVNIQPFPGQAVGARQAGDSYAFPVRVLDRNVPYSPEQLPMLMIPELRRIATLLHAVPSGKGLIIHSNTPRRVNFPVYFVQSLSEEYNCVVLQTLDARATSEGGWPTVLPMAFEEIEYVWRTPEPRWHLKWRG